MHPQKIYTMKQKLVLLIIGIVAFTTFSCKKSKENNIIGTWKQMSFKVEDTNSVITRWSFYDDKTIIARVYDHNNNLLTSVDAEYSIFLKKLKYRLQISRQDTLLFEVNSMNYRGIYVIEELSRDVLRLVRVEGLNDNGEWSTSGDSFVQLEFLKD